jgi:serpin B
MPDLGDVQAACALYESLRGGSGNLCICPFSVRLAFALCYLGARGRTADELRDAFRFPSQPETEDQLATVLGRLAARGAHFGPEGPEQARRADRPNLRVASRLWAAAGRALSEAFALTARSAFGAPVERLDFAGDPESSRAVINGWVEEATERKIVNLIARGEIDRVTKLVVTSAAHFWGPWATKFLRELTQPAPFFAPSGTVEVPLMQGARHHAYRELHDTQVLELDYARGDLTMRVAVPRSEQGLARTEGAAAEILAASLQEAKVHVFMPRFRCESRFMLDGPLSAMGLNAIFKVGDADLSGIDGTRELFVSSAVHQAFVDVDEQGTEAAASTAVGVRWLSVAGRREPTIQVRIDRPFLFWIIDKPTGTVLFAGRVVDPSNEKG